MVRRAVKEGSPFDWSELMRNEELVMAKLMKSYYQSKQDDEQVKSTVQKVMQKSTDFLRRTIVSVGRAGRGHTIVHVPSCGGLDGSTVTVVRREKREWSWWCVACVDQYHWKHPNRVLIIHDSADSSEAK